jgi:membrane protein implicated in regulation of membrane protease activity
MDILWWHWLVLGLLLVVGELATPGGFYLIFFGVAAIVVGLLASAGLAGPVPVQVLAFSVLSVALLALFRARLLRWMQRDPQAPPIDTLVGEIGTAIDTLAPDAVGKVELRGTSWSARNSSEDAIGAGARCRVVRVEGLMLHVWPEGGRS